MTQDQTARLAHIRKRYDVLAPLYRVIECVFLLPPGIRSQSVAKLELRPGDRVLELGVGTGRNLPHLVRAVGPTGSVLGVDLSPGMLARARRTCTRRGWTNVELREGDAAAVRLEPASLDGVLFSLSYGAIPDADAALRNAWRALKPGGRVVVLDARLSDDIWGRMARPFVLAASRATVLGDPDRRAWDDLRAYTDQIETSERLFGGLLHVSGAEEPVSAPDRKCSESNSAFRYAVRGLRLAFGAHSGRTAFPLIVGANLATSIGT